MLVSLGSPVAPFTFGHTNNMRACTLLGAASTGIIGDSHKAAIIPHDKNTRTCQPSNTTESTRSLHITDSTLHDSHTGPINALIALMTPYFGAPDSCHETEVYGYWRYRPLNRGNRFAVTIGMYKGTGLGAASVDATARKLFERSGAATDVAEICDPDEARESREHHTLGIRVLQHASLYSAQVAVNERWANGLCAPFWKGAGEVSETMQVQVQDVI